MKKTLAILLVIVLFATCFIFSASAATNVETINLIPKDGDYTDNPLPDESTNTTHSFDGDKFVVTAAGGWPYVKYTPESPIIVNPESTVLNLTVTLSGGGGTSIRFLSGAESIHVHHYLTEETTAYDGSGNLITMGTYELSIDFSDLKCYAGTAENKYFGMKDLVLDSDGNFIIESIDIYSVTSIIVAIEKFELVVTTETIDVPSSEEPSSSEEPTTETGDSGYIALAVIALVSLAVVIVTKKVR